MGSLGVAGKEAPPKCPNALANTSSPPPKILSFMKVLGVGLITRKLGNKTSPTVTITKEGDEYNFRQDSIKTSEFKFKVDVPFEEITGREEGDQHDVPVSPEQDEARDEGDGRGEGLRLRARVLRRQADSCLPV